VLPIFFLSGALFPLNDLPAVLKVVTRIDPLSYGIDGLRYVLIGSSQFEPAVSILVLCAVALLFLALGSYSFSRIQI